MEMHPILEEWLNDWVWPTPFRGPGVDFRMHLTRERLVPMADLCQFPGSGAGRLKRTGML